MTATKPSASSGDRSGSWSERAEWVMDAFAQHPRRWVMALAVILLAIFAARAALQPSTTAPDQNALVAEAENLPPAAPASDDAQQKAEKQWAALAMTTQNPIDVPPLSEGSERLRQLGRKMKAPGASLVEPCLEWVGVDCVHGAMDVFYQSLLDVERGTATQHATVATLGNSLIASDHITDIVRERLSERFGSGGRGMVLADRISTYGRRTRSGLARAGHWRPHNFAMGDRGKYPFGVSGVLHVSTRKGAKTRWHIDGERRADILFWDHPKAADFRLRVDGEEIKRVKSKGKNRGRRIRVSLPEGAKNLDLIADGREVVSFGANLERAKPGVIWNTFGVPAAGSTTFFESNEELFQSQLKLQKPSLVVVMLGGNETKRIQWGKRTKEQVERDFRALLHRVRSDAPHASCLAIGPIDSVTGKPPNRFRTRPPLGWVINMQQRIAREQGCTYFNLFEAMGGVGSLQRFAKHRMLHDDLVHPRSKGLDLLGELIAAALFEGYEAYAARAPRVIGERYAQISAHHIELSRKSSSAQTPTLRRVSLALEASAAPSSPQPDESFSVGWFMEEERKGASLVHAFEARMAPRFAFARALEDPVEEPPTKNRNQLLEAWETGALSSLISFDAQATLDALRSKQYALLMLLPAATSLQNPSQDLARAIQRLQEGSPEADCVLVSPLYPTTEEAADGTATTLDADGTKTRPSPSLGLDESARGLAQKTGCAFLSLREAVGGDEGFSLWQKKGWIDASGQPQEAGIPALSELMVLELLEAAQVTQRARLAQGASP